MVERMAKRERGRVQERRKSRVKFSSLISQFAIFPQFGLWLASFNRLLIANIFSFDGA